MKRYFFRLPLLSLTGCVAVVLAAAFLVIGAAEWAAAQETQRIDDFSKTLPPGELVPGWDSQKVSPTFGKGKDFFFQFVHDKGGEEHYLHVRSGSNNSFTVGSKKNFQIKAWPWLEWEWRVTQLPKGGDVRIKAKDDQAGSMCVIHDPGLVGFDSLCYIWENMGPKGAELTSTKRDDSKYVILRAADSDETGKWYAERRNIYEDFKKLFGREPTKDAVIGVQIDSDDTQSSGEVFYRNIVLKKS